jgi:drug/metabolite transporter (DMT)-like permease
VVADIPAFLAAALRHGIAGVVLYGWTRAHGASPPTLKQWGVAALVGTLLLASGNGMVNWASQRLPSGLSALIVSSVPIWIVVLDWLRPDGIRPTRRTIAGLALGSLGILGLVWSAGGPGSSSAAGASMLIGCIGLLFGSLSWAAGSILSRQLPRHHHGGLATAMEMTAAGVLLVPVSWLSGDLTQFHPTRVSAGAWAALVYLITFGSLIGFSAYTWLLRVSTPARVATYAYVNPIVAVVLGWAFAGERLTPATFGAAALILAAVATITVRPRTPLRRVSGAR